MTSSLRNDSSLFAPRAILLAVAAAFVFACCSVSTARAETRTLKMYFTHTKERATITFKKNGKYVPSGLRKANRFLRDWRRKEPTKMDPKLLDLVWEVYQRAGGKKAIHVISGYRSPKTNNMLRRRGRKVAKSSQHTRGKALDFFIPGVSVKKLRAMGLQAHGGGVGYYRGSFVHLDTGRVRHWPRMSPKALARVFPRGKTIHVPSNGRPLKGYKVARANLKRGLNADGSKRRTKAGGSLLARLFKPGNGGDENEGAAVAKKATPKKKPAPKKVPAPKEIVVAAKKLPPLAKNAASNDPFAARPAPAAATALASAEEQPAATQAAEALAQGEALAAQPETITLASLEPARLAVPSRAPRTPQAPVSNQIVAALAPVSDGSVLARATAALEGAPSGDDILRPSVGVGAAPTLRPAQQAAPADLIQTASLPDRLVPSAPTLRAPASTDGDMEALKARITQSLARGGSISGAAKAARLQRQVRADAQQVASLTDRTLDTLTRPIQRPAASTFSASTPTPRVTREPLVEGVPLPKAPRIAGNSRVTIEGGARHRPQLALGNLNGRGVKVWATSSSTRVGAMAALRAPDYRRGARVAMPASVYSAGFASVRQPRADAFTGRALTRVAFARLGG